MNESILPMVMNKHQISDWLHLEQRLYMYTLATVDKSVLYP